MRGKGGAAGGGAAALQPTSSGTERPSAAEERAAKVRDGGSNLGPQHELPLLCCGGGTRRRIELGTLARVAAAVLRLLPRCQRPEFDCLIWQLEAASAPHAAHASSGHVAAPVLREQTTLLGSRAEATQPARPHAEHAEHAHANAHAQRTHAAAHARHLQAKGRWHPPQMKLGRLRVAPWLQRALHLSQAEQPRMER